MLIGFHVSYKYRDVKDEYRDVKDKYRDIDSYKMALQTLTAADFPELHLEILRHLIRLQLDLKETDEASELQQQGTDLLRRSPSGVCPN